MHTTHSNIQYKNESSTVKWAQWDKTQSIGSPQSSNVENDTVDSQSPASQPRPLAIYGAQCGKRLRHPPVTNQQRAHTLRKLEFALCCHSNATGAPIANPPNSAQLGGSLYHSPKLHPGLCSSVGVRPRTDTDARDHNTFCVVYDSHKM